MEHTKGPRKARKVTRACDACKARKGRCSGEKPCDTCVRKGLQCSYDALYLRGRAPTPPPSATPGPSLTEHASDDVASHRLATPSHPRAPARSGSSTSYASHEPAPADIHGQRIYPASGLSFLHRARRRFSQGQCRRPTESIQQDWLDQPVSKAGDKPLLGDDGTGVFPLYHEALSLVEFYFDMCIATYRILHKPTVEQWLAVVEHNRSAGRPIFHRLGNAKSAALLGVLAIASYVQLTMAGSANEADATLQSDCLVRQSLILTDDERGLPSLERVQARLVQTFYHLMSCRFNHAWHIFGNCIQMIAVMGLQRRSSKDTTKPPGDYLPGQHRKRIFWSAYILDKYLSVVLGRPPHFHDEDIDQDYPDCVNDEDMFADGPRLNSSEDCQVDAFIFNAKIARIVGNASRSIYGVQPSTESERLAAITRLGAQVDDWHASLPPFLSTVRPSSLIRSLRRQSNALKLAHSHAVMHLYRPLLLGQGVSHRRPSMVTLIEEGSTRCIKAAETVLSAIAAGSREGGATGAAFWWTHYVTFCALAVVYVWHVQRRRNIIDRRPDVNDTRLLELANICQQHLADATAWNSPGRRYSLILEELRDEALKPGVRAEQPSEQTPSIPDTAPAAPPSSSGTAHCSPTIAYHPLVHVPTHLSADSLSTIDTPDWLNTWTNTDWIDLHASAFGILSDFSTDLVWPSEPM